MIFKLRLRFTELHSWTHALYSANSDVNFNRQVGSYSPTTFHFTTFLKSTCIGTHDITTFLLCQSLTFFDIHPLPKLSSSLFFQHLLWFRRTYWHTTSKLLIHWHVAHAGTKLRNKFTYSWARQNLPFCASRAHCTSLTCTRAKLQI